MIDQDEIRKEVAVKNNVWLGENDPVLQLATIFEKALEQAIATLNEQNERNQKALLAAVKQGLAEGKVAAKEVVKTSGEYVSDQVHTAVESAFIECAEEFKKEVLRAWVKIEAARKASYVAAGVSCACAVIMLGALVGSA